MISTNEMNRNITSSLSLKDRLHQMRKEEIRLLNGDKQYRKEKL